MTGLRVSVAVSTYQRASILPRLFAALAAQTLDADEFEVVIADDGSADDTPAVLEHLVAAAPFAARVVTAPTNRGPAAGRNLAWRAGTAPVVAFTDDDCQPAPGWLAAGLAALGDRARVVIGRTTPRDEDAQLASQPFSRTMRVDSVRFFETCNVFYRRADLERSGGFDETFPMAAGEDTDLGLRVRNSGVEPVFAPEAVVYHDVRPGNFRTTLRDTWRWVDIPLVIRLHPEERRSLLHRRFFWKGSHPPVIAAIAGVALLRVRPAAAALLLLPWLHYRLRVAPPCPGPRRRWLALPGAFVVDGLEVIVMVRGSVRHRVVVL
ncbi:MAG: hypothetical protein QOJ09_496 [Actinomycetota bacterium]|nr:hypothetical protein [Actinomycetota bacterium]